MKPFTKSTFRADIQGLRALAVTLVVIGHALPNNLRGGYIGVDVFFVISGYLITSQLSSEAERYGHISLLDFWAKRAVRILPAAVLLLVFCIIGTLIFVPRAFWDQFFHEIVASALYLQNWTLAADSIDYWSAENPASPVKHYWSLSVEEQFYLFMPLLLLAALRVRGVHHRWQLSFASSLGVLAAASLWYSTTYTLSHPSAAYYVTTTRFWEFAAGALLALTRARVPSSLVTSLSVSGLTMIGLSGFFYSDKTLFPGYAAAAPVAGTLLVIWAHPDKGVLGAILNFKPIQFIGGISYGIYLWHWPLLIFSDYIWSYGLPATGYLKILPLIVIAAWLSTRFFEEPIRNHFRRQQLRGHRIFIGLTLATISVAVVATAFPSLYLREISVLDQALGSSPCVGAGALVNPDCEPVARLRQNTMTSGENRDEYESCKALKGVVEPRHCTLGAAEGGAPRVAAIGDSHMLMYTPAYEHVAKELGWEIDVYGKPGCYFTTAELSGYTVEDIAECAAWRKKIISLLDKKPVYDIILVTHWEDSFVPSGEEGHFLEVTGLIEAWQTQIRRGAKVIALSDIPNYRHEQVGCVAAEAAQENEQCNTLRSSSLNRRDSSKEAALRLNAAVAIDTARYYCDETNCMGLIGGIPVLGDRTHITPEYAASIGPFLTQDIVEATIALGLEIPRP